MGAPIDDDINLAAAIGRVSGAWSLIESQLTVLFCSLADVNINIGAIIFNFFRSTATQAQILTRLAAVSPKSNDRVRHLLKNALGEYAVLAKERNELAHNPLGWTNSERSEIYTMIKSKVTPDDEFPYAMKPLIVADIVNLKTRIDIFQLKILTVLHLIQPPIFAAGLTSEVAPET
jgi:hypothetical protein